MPAKGLRLPRSHETMLRMDATTTRTDTEDRCHCGARYAGSDHCPACGCEQYESGDCGHTHEVGADDCCPCRDCWNYETERAENAALEAA